MNVTEANKNLKSYYCLSFEAVSEQIEKASKQGLFETDAFLTNDVVDQLKKAGFRLEKMRSNGDTGEYQISWGESSSLCGVPSSCCII